MMPGSVNIFKHAGTGTHSTVIHPGYGTLLSPMDSPLPNTSYQYYGSCVNKRKTLVQTHIQKMIGMIPNDFQIAFKILCTSLCQKLPKEITGCALYHNILPVLLMHGPAMIVDNGERSVIHCGQRCRHHGTSRQRENTARVIHQLQGLYWC